MDALQRLVLRYVPVPRFLDPVYPALDISQSSIKYIAARREGDEILPTQFEEMPLPDGCITEGEIHNESKVEEMLVRLYEKVECKYVVITLPEEYAYIYPQRLARGSAVQEKTEIEFVLSQHVPIPIEHVVYAYERVTDEIVTIIAYDARVSNEYERIVKLAHITPVACIPHIVASARVTKAYPGVLTYIIVDMGRTRTSIAFVYDGHVLGSATLYLGSKQFVDALVLSGLTVDEALQAFQTKGVEASEVLKEVWSAYVTQIQKYIDVWRLGKCSDDVALDPPQEIRVCGGFSPVPGVVHLLAESCRLPVRLVSVWDRLFSVEEHPPAILEDESFRFTSGAGLLLENR